MGNPTSLNPQKGEALLCRAYAHFLLANIFCEAYDPATAVAKLGIPYVTEPETTVTVSYERGTLAETYQKIEADLLEGLPLIEDNVYSVPKYHLTRKLHMPSLHVSICSMYSLINRIMKRFWNMELRY